MSSEPRPRSPGRRRRCGAGTAFVLAAALVAAGAGVAAGQAPPPDASPVPPIQPARATGAPPDAGTGAGTGTTTGAGTSPTPAPEPTTGAPPAVATATSTAPAPAAAPPGSPDKRRLAGAHVSFEVGGVRWLALPGPLATGVGKALVVGVRRAGHGLEIHASAGYRHEPPAEVRSVRATGHSGYFAVLYRRTFHLPRFDVSAAGGFARLSAPLYLAATDNLGSEPGAGTMTGLGVMAALGVAYPLLDGVDLAFELRTAHALWTLPPASYVETLEEQVSGVYTATYGSGEPTPVPLVVGLGLRIML